MTPNPYDRPDPPIGLPLAFATTNQSEPSELWTRSKPLRSRRRRGGRPMNSSRQLRLGAFMRPVSIHTAAWRYPGAWPDANFNFKRLTRLAQTLERGKFDAF